MVALLSYMAGAEAPIISLETSSLCNEYLICSPKSPSKAYFLIMVLMVFREVFFSSSRFRMASDPLGTGTLIALEVILFFKEGMASTTAVPAPVSVITILTAAALPRLYL